MTRFAAACLVLMSCLASLGAPPVRAAVEPALPADTTGMDWSRIAEYRMVPGDKLRLNFGPGQSSTGFLERSVVVRPDGRISVYPVGDVVAAGHTIRELETTLVDLLGATLKAPRITIELEEAAGNVVHVLGRVEKPGSYKAEPFVTLLQAITDAGGFSNDAAKNSVIVLHRDGGRTVSVARVAVDRVLRRGGVTGDVPLSRFDIVYVPRNSIGNLNVFAQQFFGPASTVLNSALVGWELFNLDRVFTVRAINGK